MFGYLLDISWSVAKTMGTEYDILSERIFEKVQVKSTSCEGGTLIDQRIRRRVKKRRICIYNKHRTFFFGELKELRDCCYKSCRVFPVESQFGSLDLKFHLVLDSLGSKLSNIRKHLAEPNFMTTRGNPSEDYRENVTHSNAH